MIDWIIYQKKDADENVSYIEWFQAEAKKQQIELILFYREELAVGVSHKAYEIYINGYAQPLPDFIVNRSIEPVLQDFFHTCHIPIFNDGETARIANHKALTHLELSKLNIPMLPTFFIHGRALPNKLPLPYPVMIKAVSGRGGKEVYFIDYDTSWKEFRRHATNQEYIVQSTNVQLGKDVRVFVIGREIIAAVLRYNKNDFRANFKLGGKAIPYTLSQEDRQMIDRITNRFQFGLVGIDFLMNHDGKLLFNEIEDVAGSRILSEVTDINLLEKYIHFIKKHVRDKRAK